MRASTCSDKIARFILNLSYGDLPSDVVDKAKFAILDLIGVAIAGSNTAWSRIISNFVKNSNGEAEARVFRYGFETTSPLAALANGTMGHSWDYDDSHPAQMHLGAVIVPAAISIGEKMRANGRELITAVVAGYEVGARVALAVNSPPKKGHTLKGFHPTATCGVFGSAAAASKVMGLSLEQIVNALGIAGSYSSGLMEFLSDGAMTKRLHPGKAAHDGIVSALLAAQGFTGPRTVFEGRDGFLRAYSDAPDVERLTSRLGEDFEIRYVDFKMYPCCWGCHSPLNALQAVLSNNDIKVSSIQKVVFTLRSVSSRIVAEPLEAKRRPKTPLEAQMSLPFCAAVVMLYGGLTIQDFTEERLKDEQILTLTEKIEVLVDPQFDKEAHNSPSVVTVITENGKRYTQRVDYPKGSSQNPMTEKEIEEKFLKNVEGILSEEKSNRVLSMVNRLEQLNDIKELTRLLIT